MDSRESFTYILVFLFLLYAGFQAYNILVEGSSYDDRTGTSEKLDYPIKAENVTIISNQGKWVHKDAYSGSLEVIETESKKVLWQHERYRRYMDVDVLGDSRILFVAGTLNQRYVVEMNWRDRTRLRRFNVTLDTHDVEKLNSTTYVVADKAGNSIYEYNYPERSIGWKYEFEENFPDSRGGKRSSFTHLNDVDLVYNGSAYLLSPRNFNTVMVIERSSKNVKWSLGQRGNHSVLKAQHNPDLVSYNPLTLLIADSMNDRVVEYSRSGGEMRLNWSYGHNLNWPRDADMLSNGNILITDTINRRILEVSRSGDVVWNYSTSSENPYEAERITSTE